MKLIILVLILINILTQFLNSQEKLTLQKAIKIGLEKNYSVRVSTLLKDKSENSLKIGTSGFLPTLDLRINQNNTINDVKQNFYDGREIERIGAKGNSLDGNLTANWKIFDGMGLFIDYDILKLQNNVSQLNLKKKSEELSLQIISYYNQLYYLQEKLIILNQNLETSRFRYNILNLKKEIGKSSGMELNQAEIDLNNDLADSIDFYNIYLQAKGNFNILLGEDIQTSYSVIDTPQINDQNLLFTELKELLTNNTDIKLADLGIQMSIQDKKKLEANYYPSINLYGAYNYNSSESQSGLLKSNTTNGLNYGITLNMNLFEGFKNNILIENNELDTEINKVSKSELIQYLEKELKFYIDSYNSNLNIYKILNKNLDLSKKNLEIAKEKLQLGTISQIEFREIQQMQLNVFSQVLLTKINLKIIENSVYKTLGSLIN